jgi:hypothetical protein
MLAMRGGMEGDLLLVLSELIPLNLEVKDSFVLSCNLVL